MTDSKKLPILALLPAVVDALRARDMSPDDWRLISARHGGGHSGQVLVILENNLAERRQLTIEVSPPREWARVPGNHDDAGTREVASFPATPTTPPRMGEILVGLFCIRARREATLGDLAEQFEQRMRAEGEQSARVWYWRQAVRSFGPFAWRWACRLVELHNLLRLIGL